VKSALDNHAEEIYRSLAGPADPPLGSPGTTPDRHPLPTPREIYDWAIKRYPRLLDQQSQLQTEMERLLREKTTPHAAEPAGPPQPQLRRASRLLRPRECSGP
jgi:hypothetical protein